MGNLSYISEPIQSSLDEMPLQCHFLKTTDYIQKWHILENFFLFVEAEGKQDVSGITDMLEFTEVLTSFPCGVV